MALLDRDIYLRNHVMGVLVTFRDKGLNYSNMGELADSITEAVIDGDIKWNAQYCEQMMEDIPQ